MLLAYVKKKQDSTTSSSSSEALSSQRPVTDNVSSSLSLYNDDSDQDLNVVPHQLSEDSSDRRLRRVEQRKLRKKKLTGMSSGKSMYLCMYVCMYVFMYICLYVCMYV